MTALMTVEELAKHLRVTNRTIYRLLKRGEIPAVKVGHKWRFDKDAIGRWLQPKPKEKELRILVIDDDPVIGLLFKEALEELGHSVVTAADGAQGLEFVERLNFDQIFLDLKMPKMDGTELLGLIRNIKPGVPVTIITGYPTGELMERALEHGPFHVMKKPFSSEDIAAAIKHTNSKAVAP